MADWEEDVWQAIDAVATTLESWGQEIEKTATQLSIALEEEVELQWGWLWEDWQAFWEDLQMVWDESENIDSDWLTSDFSAPESSPSSFTNFGEWEVGLNPYRPATAQHQPVCQGCRHYHGYVYGGNLLVCGMHPYGTDHASCPDWDSDAKSP